MDRNEHCSGIPDNCRWRSRLAKMVITRLTYHLQGARVVTKSPALANIVDLDMYLTYRHKAKKRLTRKTELLTQKLKKNHYK
jgi:hypothetical protein